MPMPSSSRIRENGEKRVLQHLLEIGCIYCVGVKIMLAVAEFTFALSKRSWKSLNLLKEFNGKTAFVCLRVNVTNH